MKYWTFLVFSLLALCFLNNCTSDPAEEDLTIEDVLPGYWEITEAKRNGKVASTLKGGYFEFDTLQSMTTNWSGAGQIVSDYKVLNNSVTYTESNNRDQKLDLEIKALDTIVFNTVLKKIHKFELTLLKVDKEK
jgi:hypothetical protein